MNNHDYSRHFGNSARITVALCALAALGGRAAQAGATAVTSPLPNSVQTNQYPTGDASSVVPASFTVAAGSNNLTFTATNPVSGSGFQSRQMDQTAAPQFSDPQFGGTAGDVIEDTTFDTNSDAGNMATGPLRIDFQQGVTGFGLLAQDYNQDTETFTLDVFNGANQIGTFTFGPADNTANPGQALFVGAQTNDGDVITSATLSSLSAAVGQQPNNGDNDFFFGRAQVQNAPVPEASTAMSFGTGILFLAGLVLGAHRRKVNGAPRTAPQTAG